MKTIYNDILKVIRELSSLRLQATEQLRAAMANREEARTVDPDLIANSYVSFIDDYNILHEGYIIAVKGIEDKSTPGHFNILVESLDEKAIQEFQNGTSIDDLNDKKYRVRIENVENVEAVIQFLMDKGIKIQDRTDKNS